MAANNQLIKWFHFISKGLGSTHISKTILYIYYNTITILLIIYVRLQGDTQILPSVLKVEAAYGIAT